MPRIGKDTPMAAYDHVSSLLREAGGGDGVVSRRDADTLVATLEAEGRGDEAFAAREIFRQVDARDAGHGHRVTGYDLGRDRAYFSGVLTRADANHNGLSKAETRQLDATSQALTRLGQVLTAPAERGRIAHATAERGLFHVAGLLRAGSGADLILSRRDLQTLTDRLTNDGRAAEALAVETFGNFIGHRDAGPGARVTDKDITAAVNYARTDMLKAYDDNSNGYARAEVEKMSKSAKAFILLGEMIDKGIIEPSHAPTADGAQRVLSGLVNDQFFDQMGSEAEMPIVAIKGRGKSDSTTVASFREAFDIPNKPIEVHERFSGVDLATFIKDNSREYRPGQGFVQTEAAHGAALATSAVLRGLEDLKVFVTGVEGESQRTTYIVGRAADDQLVGMRSSVIWT